MLKKTFYGFLIFCSLMFCGMIKTNAAQPTDADFNYTPGLSSVHITERYVNGETYFDIYHGFNGTPNNADIITVLNQSPGKTATKFTFYDTITVNLMAGTESKYKNGYYRTNNNSRTSSDVILDGKVQKRGTLSAGKISYNFWPFGLKVEYKNSEGKWVRSVEEVTVVQKLGARLAVALGLIDDYTKYDSAVETSLVNSYGTNYRFVVDTDGTVDTHLFGFYELTEAGAAKNLECTTNSDKECEINSTDFALLGQEKFYITYNKVNESDFIIYNEAEYTNITNMVIAEKNTNVTLHVKQSSWANTIIPTVGVSVKSSDDTIATASYSKELKTITVVPKKEGTAEITVKLGSRNTKFNVKVYNNKVTSVDTVKNIINTATEEEIVVNMTNDTETTIDKTVFETAKSKGKDLLFDYGDYKVEIASEDITNTDISPKFDIAIDTTAPEALEEYETENNSSLFLSTGYEGELPGKIKITINLSDFEAVDDKVYVYYYNPTTEKIEFIKEFLVGEDNTAVVELTHFSEYLISSKLLHTVKNPDTSDNIMIYITLSLISLMSVMIISNKKIHNN